MGQRALHLVVSSMCKCLMSDSRSMVIFIDVVFTKYIMNTVIVNCDVHIRYTGPSPVYRLYVGDELFAERTWIWHDSYLSERIVLEAPYGLYSIRYELLPHADAEIAVKNSTVVFGPGRFRKKTLNLEIHNEAV